MPSKMSSNLAKSCRAISCRVIFVCVQRRLWMKSAEGHIVSFRAKERFNRRGQEIDAAGNVQMICRKLRNVSDINLL